MLQKQLQKGNHKSTDLHKDDRPNVTKAMHTDVTRGFGIIMTPQCAAKIKQAEIYPLGLQHQTTINDRGEIIPKKRVCHDLSNNRKSGLSLNQRVIEEEIPTVLFGYTLMRVLSAIHHLRYFNPNERILLNKVDIEKAYRRLHTTGKMTAKCIATWYLDQMGEQYKTSDEQIAIALGRLPFGSKPAPAEFSNCSDITFDLANDLMNCDLWDVESLPCPLRKEIPPPKRLPDENPFGVAYESDVKLPKSFKGGVDGYIDDGLGMVLDSKENEKMVKRAEQCLPMALHLQFCPNAGSDEPIERAEMASMPKLKAEAFLTELIIFLGWLINTRTFQIALPDDKYKAWSSQIEEIINSKRVSHDTISTTIGRLNHVAFIIPAARHFMNRLRRLESKADKYKYAKVTAEAKKDLELWLEFLQKANKGISINNVIYQKITTQSLSDSCEMGMGGYGHHSGIAWRYEFTKEEQISFDINQKEYLASEINQEIQLHYDPCPNPCSNDITDNTCTEAWMYKSNFDPESHPINNEIARRNARNLIKNNATCYSQHLSGSMNDIADALSRDFHLSDNQLISLFEHTKPPYYPQKQMKIIQLPEEIIPWIASLAQLRIKKRELKWARTPSTLGRGIVGWSGSTTSGPMTPIFGPYHKPKEYEQCAPLCTPSEEATFLPMGIRLKAKQRKRPSIMWQRPCSQVVGSIPASTRRETKA